MPKIQPALIIVGLVVFGAVCAAGCSRGNQSQEFDPLSPFVDGMSIRPYPNGQERQDAVIKKDSISVRVSPSARPSRVDFNLVIENLASSSIWLEPISLSFDMGGERVVVRMRCVNLTQDNREVEIITSDEEIFPASSRHFLVTGRWDDNSIPKSEVIAELKFSLKHSDDRVLPFIVKFFLGPSPYSK